MMDGAIKRAIRLSRKKEEYYVGKLNDQILVSPLIDVAMDCTMMNDEQVNILMNILVKKGYIQAHFVTFGLMFVDEYGEERQYERPFIRADIEHLVALADEDYLDIIEGE